MDFTIKYLKAKNFMSVGDTPIEVDFTKYGNIVVISGQNLDVGNNLDAADEEHFSNGSGKSSLSEIISYGLYGKCIRKINHGEVINAINKKKLEIEIKFTKNNNEYHIIRKRKPDSLELYQDDIDITQNSNVTQKHIEYIIGLNHKAFVNMVCFGQHNSYDFLDCETSEQRAIIESILSLGVYKEYSEVAKSESKNIKQNLKNLIIDYEKMKDNEFSCQSRIDKIKEKESLWRQSCEKEITQINESIALIEEQMSKTDNGNAIFTYEKYQLERQELQKSIPHLNEQKQSIASTLPSVKDKYDELRLNQHKITIDLASIKKNIDSIKNNNENLFSEIKAMKDLKQGVRCDHCYGTIDIHNYQHVITLKNNNIESNNSKISEHMNMLEIKKREYIVINDNIIKLKSLIDSADTKIELISKEILKQQERISEISEIQMPSKDSKQLLLSEKLSNYKEKLSNKSNELLGGGPYEDILGVSQQEFNAIKDKCIKCKSNISESEKLIPYYDFWTKGFSDEGIRSFIIEGIIPALNAKISYWLQFLIDGKLKVSFDRDLNATIERNPPNGDPFAYSATCGGEKRRIDLAISQAFSHIVMLSSGTKPSLVFLDEVGTNIDKRGLNGIFKMICELANDKQVFVITHDQTLLDMLDGADLITIRKENGFSIIA